jgi:UDP-galactopyranose mutase
MKVKIIGCGLSGITSAILLKEKGYDVEIFESRPHIGGNCHDTDIAGTMVHTYGPHIFHTDDEDVYSLLSRYTEWLPFRLQPKGNTALGLISLPYSKKTIKEIGRELTQEEIVKYIFKDYSEKQWGVSFDQIPQTITNRIPKTKDCEDPTWFEGQKYQCIPKYGYTAMMQNMLEGIKVYVGVEQNEWKKYNTDLTVYTGKIDEYFNYCYGKLPYRSLRFEHTFTPNKLDTFIINQNTHDVKYTRMYDHSYFTYKHKGHTYITKEYPIACEDNNIPFYPVAFADKEQNFSKYKLLAEAETNVIFAGRLATYAYLDMWMAIKQAMLKIKNKIQ